ncbi:Asp23/Gls24 family envelope stress response protein OS=Streptomyces alboniger OX=132473 GN=CP975_01300 PE=4 SV=1 [Streptomyces alboniger]
MPGQVPDPAGAQRPPRGPVVIHLAVEVALTWALQEVADKVRHRVLDVADAELGMRVVGVDVTIADIIDDSGTSDDSDDEGEERP